MERILLHSLYGTEITQKHCVGYCKRHGCYMTVHQLKTKECLKKQCRALDKHEHEYWRQRELKKIMKKQRVVTYE